MGDNKIYFKRNKGTKEEEEEWKEVRNESYKTNVRAQPLVGRNAEPGRATVSST